MFGMEKPPKEPFEFDLEKDLRENPKMAHNLIKDVEGKIAALKNTLRSGCSSKAMNECGVLLQGFAALQKVLNRVSARK